MDGPLSLRFLQGSKGPLNFTTRRFPNYISAQASPRGGHHYHCRRPPVASYVVSRDLVFKVGVRIRKVQKSEGKYFNTVTCAFVRCSEACVKLQWRCATFRICILLQLAFSRDLFPLQLHDHHKPNVQRKIGLNVCWHYLHLLCKAVSDFWGWISSDFVNSTSNPQDVDKHDEKHFQYINESLIWYSSEESFRMMMTREESQRPE